jgi:hypothetical protein
MTTHNYTNCSACNSSYQSVELCKWCCRCARCSPRVGYYQGDDMLAPSALCAKCLGSESIFCDKCARVGPLVRPCHCEQCYRGGTLCAKCQKCNICAPRYALTSYCGPCRDLILRDFKVSATSVSSLEAETAIAASVAPMATIETSGPIKCADEAQQSDSQVRDLSPAASPSQESSVPAKAYVAMEHIPAIKDRSKTGLRLTLPPLRGSAPRVRLPSPNEFSRTPSKCRSAIDLDQESEIATMGKLSSSTSTAAQSSTTQNLGTSAQQTFATPELTPIEVKIQRLHYLRHFEMRVLASSCKIPYYCVKSRSVLIKELAVHPDCAMESIETLIKQQNEGGAYVFPH